MTEVTRHFTATTFVVHGHRVLLHQHPKQGLWLPPGGHIERDELPHDAAIREIEEETGLRLHLHSEPEAASLSATMDCLVVPQPAFILVEDINPFHQHIDFVYYASLSDPELPQIALTNGFKWMSVAHLQSEAGVPVNVIEGARMVIDFYQRDAG